MTILVTFPINEPLRFPLLSIEWFLMVICFQIGFVFIVKYRRQQASKHYKQELGYASMFLGFSALWICIIIADYFTDATVISPFLIWRSGSQRDIVLNVGFMLLTAGSYIFIILIEKHQILLLKRYMFSLIFGVFYALYFVFFFQDIEIASYINIAQVLVFAVAFVLFLFDLAKRMKSKRAVALTFASFITCFCLLGCGYFLTIDAIIELTGFFGRLVGSSIQLIAFILIAAQFLRLPQFSQLDWHKQIEDLYIIDKAGVCLFQKSFENKEKMVDDNLVSSALSSVNYILQEMTAADDEGISTIKKGDKTITMFSSELVNGVIISKDENYLINYNLKNFITTFEAIYRRVLLDWNGDSKVFSPAEAMVEKIFSG